MPIPEYPTLVLRSQKGAPLLDAELDGNFSNIRQYDLTLAALLAGSVNPDGTLVAGSVGSAALQAAAVTLASLNPALLYSIIPVDDDTGTVNAYAITARGGLGGVNLVTPGAAYDANGNYVLTGLTLNYGYFWTQNTNDQTLIVNNTQTVSVTGAFTASQTSVTLTGTPNDPVTATVMLSAPISSYKEGQLFFIWTSNTNAGTSTLNVNNLGQIPILLNGQPLQPGDILANSMFVVVYKNGTFNLFGGSASASSATNTLTFTVNGTTLFTTGNIVLPTVALSVAHGFGVVPNSVSVYLQKMVAGDATTVAVGQQVPVGEFQVAAGVSAYLVSFDSSVIKITPVAGTITLGGVNITTANWQMIINASKQTNVSSYVFPALDYWVANPSGAFSYQGTLVVFNLALSTAKVFGSAINLSTNEATLLTPQASGQPDDQNHAIFTRANGSYDSVFSSTTGLYRVPAVSPQINLVPSATAYPSNQLFPLTISASTAYTLTKGVNDISYSLDGVTFTTLTALPVLIPNTNLSTTLTLKGNAGGVITASVVATGIVWQPSLLWNLGSNLWNFKPVWIAESGGNITDVYVASSNLNSGQPISALIMFHVNASTAVEVGAGATRLDLTNASIVNIAGFNTWYAAGTSQAKVTFFQYNPLSKRMYVMTSDVGLMHIFQLTGNYGSGGVTNDITAFWAATNNATKYGNVAYIKSIAVGGNGNFWNDNGKSNVTIEIDQVTGLEKAIVFTRQGSASGGAGSVTRVPWGE